MGGESKNVFNTGAWPPVEPADEKDTPDERGVETVPSKESLRSDRKSRKHGKSRGRGAAAEHAPQSDTDEGSFTGSESSYSGDADDDDGSSIDGTSPAVIAQVSELLNYVYGKTSVPGQIDRVSTIMRAYEGREAVLLELLETKALIKANTEPEDGRSFGMEGGEELPERLRTSMALQQREKGAGNSATHERSGSERRGAGAEGLDSPVSGLTTINSPNQRDDLGGVMAAAAHRHHGGRGGGRGLEKGSQGMEMAAPADLGASGSLESASSVEYHHSPAKENRPQPQSHHPQQQPTVAETPAKAAVALEGGGGGTTHKKKKGIFGSIFKKKSKKDKGGGGGAADGGAPAGGGGGGAAAGGFPTSDGGSSSRKSSSRMLSPKNGKRGQLLSRVESEGSI
uniref:Uncharacterized protein n=1 Tax=Odontella aurita TaxID=265563 RepID=A0A7S4JVP6_9STRA|mmetsp:Transcript_55167/g.165292  ORF Transcript_55167/g.165292 Transcript_55167/m.165292 type:complete len:398 (+) Transcript_55167:492-1685(+)